MLRVTVDINGREIGQVAAVKASPKTSGVNTYEIYDVRGVSAGESVVEQGEHLVDVSHQYEDGAAVLVKKVMDAIESLPE